MFYVYFDKPNKIYHNIIDSNMKGLDLEMNEDALRAHLLYLEAVVEELKLVSCLCSTLTQNRKCRR